MRVEITRTRIDKARVLDIVRARCGRSSMVEFQSSKLATRVRFPPPAPLFAGLSRTQLIPPRAARRQPFNFVLPLGCKHRMEHEQKD
jgi:hypothetical protein